MPFTPTAQSVELDREYARQLVIVRAGMNFTPPYGGAPDRWSVEELARGIASGNAVALVLGLDRNLNLIRQRPDAAG